MIIKITLLLCASLCYSLILSGILIQKKVTYETVYLTASGTIRDNMGDIAFHLVRGAIMKDIDKIPEEQEKARQLLAKIKAVIEA